MGEQRRAHSERAIVFARVRMLAGLRADDYPVYEQDARLLRRVGALLQPERGLLTLAVAEKRLERECKRIVRRVRPGNLPVRHQGLLQLRETERKWEEGCRRLGYPPDGDGRPSLYRILEKWPD